MKKINFFTIIFTIIALPMLTSAQSQSGRMLLDSDSSASAKSNVETEFKVEKGEKSDEGDPDEPVITGEMNVKAEAKESGEKGGTADINIGIGEMQEDSESGERVMQPEYGAEAKAQQQAQAQYNQSDLDFLRARAGGVAVSAVEVRGWDSEKKQQFMAEVKSHAEVRSEQDLEHFAQGILLEYEQIESVDINYDQIRTRHRQKAKFLGLFNSEIDQETTITFGDGEHGRVPQQVKVKYPWYRFLFKIDSGQSADNIEQQLDLELNAEQTGEDTEMTTESDTELSAYVKVLASLGNALNLEN